MALKDTWKNKVDEVDDILAEDINAIAEAVIKIEQNGASVDLSNYYTKEEIDGKIQEEIGYISIHDDLSSIVPKEGQIYTVKYHDMPYGEDPNLISPEVFWRIRIGDGITPLSDLPDMSNIVAGEGGGSVVSIDPTYDNGDDGIEAANNVASGQYGVSLGKYLKNRAKAAVALNYDNEITENGSRSFVANVSNRADSPLSFVAGYKNVARGAVGRNTIFGGANEANGEFGFQAGKYNYLGENANNVVQLGYELKSNASNQIVLGQFNEEDDNAVIILGTGTSESDRKNALVVKKDGNVVINGEMQGLGDIDAALDAILAIQETIVGGAD